MMVELGFAQLESDYLTKLVARFDSDKVRHDRLLILIGILFHAMGACRVAALT